MAKNNPGFKEKAGSRSQTDAAAHRYLAPTFTRSPLRRAEFQILNPAHLIPFLQQVDYVVLGMVTPSGTPYQTQVNAVWHEGALCFHSSPGGAKMKLLQAGSPVHAVATLALSLLPSDFFHPQQACGATQFFLSLHLEGQAWPVDEASAKCEILNALMQRFQPQGNYQPLAPGEQYDKDLAKTAVIKVVPHSMVGKFKLGQNLSPAARADLMRQLEQRGTPVDLLTLQWMKAFS